MLGVDANVLGTELGVAFDGYSPPGILLRNLRRYRDPNCQPDFASDKHVSLDLIIIKTSRLMRNLLLLSLHGVVTTWSC